MANGDTGNVLDVLNRAIASQKANAGKRPVVAAAPPNGAGSRFAGLKATGSAAVASGDDYGTHNWFTDIVDDAVPDDLGGMVPGARPLGAAVGAGLENYTKATALINQASAFTQAALPGGIDKVTWDQASQVSAGQVFAANAAAYGWTAARMAGYEAHGQIKDAPSDLYQPDFDITNPEQRKSAFEHDPLGKISSGAFDAAVSWFLDPLVVGGKALKIARYGSEMLNLPGALSSSTNIPKVIEHIKFDTDASVLFRESGGAAGVANHITEAGDHIARSDFNTLIQFAPFKSSPYRDLLAGVGAEITDPRIADIYYAAASGSEKHLVQLRSEAQSVSDALVNYGGWVEHEKRALAGMTGMNDPAMLDDVLEANYSASTILDDLANRNQALYDALYLFDKEGSHLISQTGAASRRVESAKNAWTAGKAQRDLPPASRALTQTVTPEVRAAAIEQAGRFGADTAGVAGTAARKAPAIAESVFQASSAFRKVRLWQWASGQRSAGFINTRTFDDGKSADELLAMANDTPAVKADGDFKSWMLNTWGQASTDAERYAAAEQVQRAIVVRTAERHGLPSELLLDQYEHLVRQRTGVVNTLRRPGKTRAFGVEPETGDLIVATPQLVSQLETQVPLMNMRLLDQTAERLAKSPLYRGAQTDIHSMLRKALGKEPVKATEAHAMTESVSEIATRWADEVNSIWKAAVLLRLGYTQRNVAEGWLRSWAYLGKIPALSPVMAARGVKNVLYANPRAARTIKTVDAAQTRLANVIGEQRAVLRQIDNDLVETYPVYRVDAAADGINWEKPHGLYMSQVERREASPHYDYIAKDAGGDVTELQGAVAKSDVLDVQPVKIDATGLRGSKADNTHGLTDADAGVGYLLNHVKGADAWVEVARNGTGRKMSAEFEEKLRALDDSVDWDLYYDNYERLMAVGGILARRAGHKAIRMVDEQYAKMSKEFPGIQDFTEIAVLDKAAMRGVPDPALLHQRAAVQSTIDNLTADIASWEAKRTGVRKQFIGDDAAFAGKIGDVYRAEASNARTVENFFESRTDRDYLKRLSDRQYALIKPSDEQYYSELAQSVKQFRADPMATQLIDGKPVDEVLAWAHSTDAKSWAKELGLDSAAERTAHVRKINAEIGNYLPTARARKAAAGENLPTPAQLQASLSDVPQDTLAAIHGRQVRSLLEAEGKGVFRRTVLQPMFNILGSMPESALVRQPFYNSVFTRERDLLTAKLTAQGSELTAEAAETISRTAHRRALQATNETLFTITRYSNPAAFLRFVSPFFAAWENSLRTWGRMIYRDPSIAARASILWNLPANLGMVYDSQTGEKLKATPFSFIATNPNAVMSLPGPLASLIGGANGGLGSVVPLQSMNVISPGESPWLPGFNAPMVAVPLGNVLAQRPDVQEWLKGHLGETVYNQFIPLGNAQGGVGGLTGQVMPAYMRKSLSLIRKDDDENYVKVLAAITQDALVDDQLGIAPFNEKQVRARADDFFKFATLANLTLPVSLMRVSKYQPQLDAWHNLSADSTKTYAEKVGIFRQQFGDAFMPLTMSTTASKAKNLDPTLETWRTVTDNPDQVNFIAGRYGTDAVGVLAATAPDGAMNQGVYNYWLDQPANASDGNWKSKAPPYEIQKNSQVAQMWSSYSSARAARDADLASLGVNPETGRPWTINSKAAENAGIVQKWASYKDQMAAKYKDIWTVYGPQAYLDSVPKTLAVVSHLLSDKQFMAGGTGKSQVWQDLARYMRVRADGVSAIRNGADSSYVKEQWTSWSAAFKASSSIKFQDFWDTYLENDDLSAEVPSGSR